jgi:hypothetical protein
MLSIHWKGCVRGVRRFGSGLWALDLGDQHNGHAQNHPDRKNIEEEQGDAEQGDALVEQGQDGVVEQYAPQEEQSDQEPAFRPSLIHRIAPLGCPVMDTNYSIYSDF